MKKPLTHVTDHALLRYLERVQGVDIDALRRELGTRVGRIARPGATGVQIDGMSYRLQTAENGTHVVCTVRPVHLPNARTGRCKHKRPIAT